ncbi:hypothetical protein [Cohnella lupini]|uniref:Uncharacterized protein n=1 Tax=Cohnella lupini TaxID=1294267 RepID=A0A3D9IUE3_9BACL|nr:hypothetical protein [Cohnella lupini]RED64736.1 hypothetical protein DFP95_102157 [Cohnella lupini]
MRERSNANSHNRSPFIGAVRSATRTPTIGGHRQQHMLGAHRQQESEPELQQTVGNQATQQLLASSATDGNKTDPYTINPYERNPYERNPYERNPYESDGNYGRGNESVDDMESEEAEINGFSMKPMGDGMRRYDILPQKPYPHMAADMESTTFYADTDDKRTPYKREFDEQGRLTNKSDNSHTNSIGAERPGAEGAKADRHIFAMDWQGEFYSADAIKENKQRSQEAKDANRNQMQRFHHSSFLGGDDVAGAGEMQVRDGQVELVSDTSGHYRPGSKQMIQTVKQLEKNNVPMEKMGVEFVGKSGINNGYPMQASASELLAYSEHNPENAEKQMREEHRKKNETLRHLLKNGQVADMKPSDNKNNQEIRNKHNMSKQLQRFGNMKPSYLKGSNKHKTETHKDKMLSELLAATKRKPQETASPSEQKI